MSAVLHAGKMHAGEESSAVETHARALIRASTALGAVLRSARRAANAELLEIMEEAFCDEAQSRGWGWRDADEAMELATVRTLLSEGPAWERDCEEWDWNMLERVEKLASDGAGHGHRDPERSRNAHFATPAGVAWTMARAADIRGGDRILEPSAGLGMLIAAASTRRQRIAWTVNEWEPIRHHVLRKMFTGATHRCSDALHGCEANDGFDIVMMNPPFSRGNARGGRRSGEDVRHVAAAARQLRPGGRLVAITSQWAKPETDAWDRVLGNESPYTTIWTKRLAPTIFGASGIKIGTRMSIVERESCYRDHDWKAQRDELCESTAEVLGMVLTSVPERAGAEETERVTTRSRG